MESTSIPSGPQRGADHEVCDSYQDPSAVDHILHTV